MSFKRKREFSEAKIKRLLPEATIDRLWRIAGKVGFETMDIDGERVRNMDMALGLALRYGLNFLEGKPAKGDIIIIKK